MKKFWFGLAVLVLAVSAVVGGIFAKLPRGKFLSESSSATAKIDNDLQEAIDVVTENYTIPEEKGKFYEGLTESSVQGMLFTLDPHSHFFTRDEFKKLYEDQSSRFYGIGVSILRHRDGVYVESIVKGTPAEKAGLRYGDRFVEVNGKDAKDWTSAELSNNVRGERGTTVNVKIERAASEKPLEFNIIRDGVPYPSVRNYFMLRDDIGYIGFTGGFQETSAEEIDAAMKQLKSQGMKQLILDIRGNPGGLLPQAIEVTSRFIPEGEGVVSVKGRASYIKQETYKANGENYQTMPLVVMINNGSASASEIVSGALQDHDRAVIVGTTSFGKGLVQKVFQLPSGTGLTLTTARYYTPYGRSLQRDYSDGSIYDYYTHQNQNTINSNKPAETPVEPTPSGSPVTTANGRVLYGGRGIEPDLKVSPLAFNELRARVAEAAFFFTRQLVAGKIEGLDGFKADKQDFEHILRPNDFPINDKILDGFRAFLAKNKDNGLTSENLNSDLDFVKNRLRDELSTATYSNEAGQQVLLEQDPQVLKALEALPEARKLVQGN